LAIDFVSLESAVETHSETSTTSIRSGKPTAPVWRFATIRNRIRIER